MSRNGTAARLGPRSRKSGSEPAEINADGGEPDGEQIKRPVAHRKDRKPHTDQRRQKRRMLDRAPLQVDGPQRDLARVGVQPLRRFRNDRIRGPHRPVDDQDSGQYAIVRLGAGEAGDEPAPPAR